MKNGDKVCDKCGKIMSADEVYNCYRSTSKGILPMKAKYINDTIQKQEAEQTVETLVNCHDCLSFEQCKTKYGPHSNCANGTPIRCDTWQSKDQSKQEPETTFSTVEKTEAENKECTIAWKPEASDVPDGTGHISVVMDENPLRKQLIKIIGRVIARVGSAKPEGNLINICKRPSMFPDLDKGQTLLLRLSEFYDSIVRIENKKTKDNDFLVYSYETLIYACLHRIAQLENDNGEITNE
jgi:hypothetical protein